MGNYVSLNCCCDHKARPTLIHPLNPSNVWLFDIQCRRAEALAAVTSYLFISSQMPPEQLW